MRGNVVDLAVGVVIGAAFMAVVQAMVKGPITPLLGAFGGVPDFAALAFTVNGSQFAVGEFVNALVSFLLVALVVYYFVVVPVNRMMERVSPTAPTATQTCPKCLSKISAKAKRCAFCTSPVGARTE